MGKKIVYILIAFLLILNISTVITILHGSGGLSPSYDMAEVSQVIADQLGVDEAQAARISSIRESFETELVTSEQALAEKQNELVRLVSGEYPDMNRVNALIEDIGRMRTQLQKEAVAKMLQEKNVLNPEQQRQYFDEFNTQLGRGQGGSGRGMGRNRWGSQGRGWGKGRSQWDQEQW